MLVITVWLLFYASPAFVAESMQWLLYWFYHFQTVQGEVNFDVCLQRREWELL